MGEIWQSRELKKRLATCGVSTHSPADAVWKFRLDLVDRLRPLWVRTLMAMVRCFPGFRPLLISE
jgi:hypothetical protein